MTEDERYESLRHCKYDVVLLISYFLYGFGRDILLVDIFMKFSFENAFAIVINSVFNLFLVHKMIV